MCLILHHLKHPPHLGDHINAFQLKIHGSAMESNNGMILTLIASNLPFTVHFLAYRFSLNPNFLTHVKELFYHALRAFGKQKAHAIINIVGLSVGLASAMLIFLYLNSELTFDDVFPNGKQTYDSGSSSRIQRARSVQYRMGGGWGKRLKKSCRG